MQLAAAVLAGGLAAFTAQAYAIQIEHAKGTTVLPAHPERVVVIGLGPLDTLDAMGIKPLAVSKTSPMPDYLSHYANDPELTVAGSLREPNFETIYSKKPDLIIVGARAADQYQELSEIAPTIVYDVEPAKGFWNSTKQQWRNLAKAFGQQAFIEQKITDIEQRLRAIKAANKQHAADALTVMSAGGNITTFGRQSRFSAIYQDFGFQETVPGIKPSRHGDLISYEFIRQHNPSTLLVIDKDWLINDGTSDTREDFANPLVKATRAYRNQRLAFLDINAWYLTIGGIRATEQMIDDIQALSPTQQ